MNPSALAARPELYSDIIAVQSSREELYGNGHFVWHQHEKINGESKEKIIEYWARDNRYFRIDKQSLSNGEPSGNIGRIIARPEGLAKIEASDTDDPGAIYDIGRPDEGVTKVKGQYFVAMANRIATVQVQTYIQQWLDEKPNLHDLEFTRDDAGQIVGSFSREIEQGTKNYEVVMSAGDYRVKSWEMRFQENEGETRGSDTASVTYGDGQKAIPLKTADTVVSNTDYSSEFACRLIEFQLDPAPMEAFAVSGLDSPHANPWFRRLILCSTGLVMLIAYLLFRRRPSGQKLHAD